MLKNNYEFQQPKRLLSGIREKKQFGNLHYLFCPFIITCHINHKYERTLKELSTALIENLNLKEEKLKYLTKYNNRLDIWIELLRMNNDDKFSGAKLHFDNNSRVDTVCVSSEVLGSDLLTAIVDRIKSQPSYCSMETTLQEVRKEDTDGATEGSDSN